MNRTSIEWVKNPDGSQGYTFNPITGCLNGCEYCYARRLANTRLNNTYRSNDNVAPQIVNHQSAFIDPFYPRFWEDRLFEPADKAYLTKNNEWVEHRQKAKGIFVCDMSDLFGIGIPEDWTRRVLDTISISKPTHRFYLLTKQPQNLIKFSPFPDNAWVGVSTPDTISFSKAMKYLAHISAKVKFISIEPMQSRILTNHWELDRRNIGWVIIGAQTKPTVYPKIEWVREIVEACDKAGISVFLKNNLKPLLDERWPFSNSNFTRDGLIRQEVPNG